MINIALVDDHKALLKQMTDFLRSKGFKVSIVAEDGDEMLEMLSSSKQKDMPHFIFVDVRMPRMDGVALTNILTTQHPAIAVIGLSMYADEIVVKDMFASGAKGYITKNNFQNSFENAIATINRGQLFFDISISEELKPTLQRVYELRQGRGAAFYGLSENEMKFFQLFATNMAKNSIAKILNISPKSIHNFTDKMRQTAGIGDRQGLTIYALQNGIAQVAKFPAA